MANYEAALAAMREYVADLRPGQLAASAVIVRTFLDQLDSPTALVAGVPQEHVVKAGTVLAGLLQGFMIAADMELQSELREHILNHHAGAEVVACDAEARVDGFLCGVEAAITCVIRSVLAYAEATTVTDKELEEFLKEEMS